MRITKLQLIDFKRFDNLTIDLTENPKKIIWLVGPNWCWKSSVFDAFSYAVQRPDYSSKKKYSRFLDDTWNDNNYNWGNCVKVRKDDGTNNFDFNDFYVRSPNRYIERLKAEVKFWDNIQQDPWKPDSTSELDKRWENNYSFLIQKLIEEFENGEKTWPEYRQEYIDKINWILNNLLDIKISKLASVTNPWQWDLYFEKWNSKDFPFKNLSSWEKVVIDFIIDLIVKLEIFQNKIICIDEPELHLNTAIQKQLLIEIDKLIPDNCQLWIATHSIGFIRAMQNELNDKTDILDFSAGNYYDWEKVIKPIKKTRENMRRIFSTALDDLTWLLAPSIIVYCEWRGQPNWQTWEEKWTDAIIYNEIFSEDFPDYYFISAWWNSELENYADLWLRILQKAFIDVDVLQFKDRDVESDWTVTTLEQRDQYLRSNSKLRMLKRRELENYLFDFEILSKKYPQITIESYNQIIWDINNDDIKSKISDLKTLCGENRSINKETWKKELWSLITNDTEVYRELKSVLENV